MKRAYIAAQAWDEGREVNLLISVERYDEEERVNKDKFTGLAWFFRPEAAHVVKLGIVEILDPNKVLCDLYKEDD